MKKEVGGNIWTFMSKCSFQGRSLCLPVRSCLQKLIHQTSLVSLNVHSALWNIYKWICSHFQEWLWSTGQALGFATISDDFVKDLAKCLHVFPSWFCALIIIIIIAKLKHNVIRPNWFKFWTSFYKHGISCVLVIVHRILREYQNWTEFKLTHEWSCEN